MTVSSLKGSLSDGFTALALGVSAIALSATAFPITTANAQAQLSNQVPAVNMKADDIEAALRMANYRSKNGVSILVYGGNRELCREVFNAAQDLYRENVPVSVIFGPEPDQNLNETHLLIIINERLVADGLLYNSDIENVKQTTYNGVRQAYEP